MLKNFFLGPLSDVFQSIKVSNTRIVGEPDAVAPQVRFDEQGQETASWQAGLRRWLERDANSYRKPKTTAPVLDSTYRKVANFFEESERLPLNLAKVQMESF